MGGRCEILASAGDEDAALEPQLELKDCERCSGLYACEGISKDKIERQIGCGSCMGDHACEGLSVDATIGTDSCKGFMACYQGDRELNTVLLDSQTCQ